MTGTETPIPLKKGDRPGIVAGGGLLPLDVARALQARGLEPFVAIIDGEPGTRDGLLDFPHERVPLHAFPRILPLLRGRGVTHAILAGAVTRRPPIRSIEWSLATLALVPAVLKALAGGDDGLLRGVVRSFEKAGIRVVGPHEIVPDLIAMSGPLTRTRPLAADATDLHAAAAAARAIGALDIGQAAIAIGGRAVALEGAEGTDGLLERMKDLRRHGRLANRQRGVIVKCAKPGQELRADLPAIGPATVEAAHAAGLAGIGVEAGRTFVLDYGRTIARADELGLFVVGLPPETSR